MRAMREARSAAALNHPNVVAVYDVVDHDGRPWLVMEYVDGQTLAEILADEGRLPPQQVAGIGALLADALDRAHERGIVHRDVKPGNVLVDRGGRPKISDFGIARGHGDDQLTQTGFVSGTPGYLSPELARGGDPDPASDVWALGATLVRRGRGPAAVRGRSNPLALLREIATEPPRPMQHAGGAGAGDRRDDGPGPGPPLGHGHRGAAPGRDLPRRHLPAGGHAGLGHAGRRDPAADDRGAAGGDPADGRPARRARADGHRPGRGRTVAAQSPPARCRRRAHRTPDPRRRGTFPPVGAGRAGPRPPRRARRLPGQPDGPGPGRPGHAREHRHPDGAAHDRAVAEQQPAAAARRAAPPPARPVDHRVAQHARRPTTSTRRAPGADDQHALDQPDDGGRRRRRR